MKQKLLTKDHNYQLLKRGARSAIVVVVGNGHGDTSSKPARGISHSTNTLGKDMNPVIHPP